MARRPRNAVEISLFPFLSVLVSVIGVLTLIIIGTTLGTSAERMDAFPDIDAGMVDKAKREAQRDLLRTGIEIRSKRLKELQRKLAELVKLRPVVTSLEDKAAEQQAKEKADQIHLQRLLAQVQAEQRRYEGLVREQNADNKIGISVPPGLRGKASFHPIYLDCRRDGLRILQSGTHIATARIASSSEFGSLLRNLKAAKRSWCAFLLVRPDGMEAFQKAYKLIRESEVRYGMYPVLTRKDFDATDWQKPDWLK